MSSRRAARELSQVVRNMVESLEGRVLLSGAHETQLLGAISSALQDNAGSTLSAFNSRLTNASELGQSLPLIGSGLSSFDPGAELDTVLNRVTSGYTTLSQLTSALEGAAGIADGVAVAGSRDLPDDVEIDLQFSLSANKTVPISASFGSAFTASGSIGLNTTLTENLTVGAYWDSDTSTPVFYINAPGTSIQVAASVTAASLNATAQLGFVSLHVTGASASFTPTFTFSLTAPSDPNVPAGDITASELTDGTTPISSMVSASLGQASPTTLTANFSTSLAPTAAAITFTWADINNPTGVTSSLNSDSALSQLSSLTNINSDSFSSGIDLLTSSLESLATTSLSNLSIFQKKLPLLNKSIASEVNFQQFFKTNLSNLTDEVPNPSTGILTSPFQNSDEMLSLLQSIPGSAASVASDGGQIVYTLAFSKTINDSVPLSLNLGSALNLNVTSMLNFSVDVAVNLQFGVDGSTGSFFVVASNQPAVQLTASLSATVNGSASLGFLSINVNNGTLSGTSTGSITLEDPQTDSPATPGIITENELSSANISSMLNVAFSGSASASLPLSTTVPGISPVTLAISWPDLTDPSSINVDTSGLDQFLGFNGLSTQTVLGYLEELPSLLSSLSGPGGLGKSLQFLGSSVGKAAALGDKLDSFIEPLKNDNINTVQDLETYLSNELSAAASSVALNVSSTDIDFSFDFGQSYNGSSSWSLGQSIGGGLLSLQTSGTLPLTASFDAKLEVGISLTSLSDPLSDFYIIEGPNSQVTGNFSVNATDLTATATVGYLATVGVVNGTATASGSLSLPLGSDAAGTHLTLGDLAADPTKLFGPLTLTGSANVNLPLSGLPGQTTSPLPYVGLTWSDITDASTLALDTSSINFDALNPLANFDASSFLSSIQSVLSLVETWGASSIMKTDIPLINEPVSSVLDFVGEAESVFQQIDSITATTPSAFDAAIEAAPQVAGFLASDVQLVAGSLDNPAEQSFDYVLQFHKSVSVPIPFAFGPGIFSINGNVDVNLTFDTNLEFGYDPTDGFYIVGNTDPADPAVSLSANITGDFDRIGGTIGVSPLELVYGISNGTANANFGLSLNVSPTGKDPISSLTSDSFTPSLIGSASLNLPIGLTIGSDGPGVTTTFSASWDPNRETPFEFGPDNSTDISDGFTSVNFDIGEFVNKIIGPVLTDIQQNNPIPHWVTDILNYQIPIIGGSIGDVLGSDLDNPAVKLLLGINTVISDLQGINTAISDMPTSGAESVNLSSYFQAGTMPDTGDSGGPMGGVPPSGNPNGTPTSGSFGLFSSFQQTLENDYYMKIPVLDSPTTSIISILTGKPVTLLEFDPGKVDLSETKSLKTASVPLVSFGFGDISASIAASIGVDLFANVDIELTTRGLEGTYITNNALGMHQSPKLLDGLAIGDGDQYQAGISISGGITLSGNVDILGFTAATLSGTLSLSGVAGVHINDVAYKPNGAVQGIANYQGNGAGDNEVYLDELEYIDDNDGLDCAIMPGGALDIGYSLDVSALHGFFSKNIASGEYTIADYDFPCVPVVANLSSIQNHAVVMNPDGANDMDIAATLVDDPTTGLPQYLRVGTTNDSTNDYQLYALSDLAADGVDSIVMEGTPGDDTFFIQPDVSTIGGIHFFTIDTGDGDDRVDLSPLTADNSDIQGITVNGGNGNDTIIGNYAPDVINLGSGANQVITGTANDLVNCSSGTDTIGGSDGNNTVNAGSGIDFIGLGDGNNLVNASSGTTTISVGNGKNVINAGSGTDTINTGDGDNKIFGDNGGSDITVGTGQNIITGGAGDDSITGGGGNDFISPGTGNNTVDGGSGLTLLDITGDGDQVLGKTTVSIAGLGTTSFTNISSIALNGGPGNNMFTVGAWPGSPVQINGGGGIDTIFSAGSTDFVLTDTSLSRSDGAKFSLSGISSAILTGNSDNVFDLTGWHGTATLTEQSVIKGLVGVDTLVVGGISSATLSDTTLTRSGAGNITLNGITRAQLTTVAAGGASIDASNYSGSVALYGQGSGNTLIGGTGSDYIVGGVGADTLTGKGTGTNQIVGGSGSGDTILGGPGTNLLVGSSGGGDTITVGAGGGRVYILGGNTTVHAEVGNTVVYDSGTGNNVLAGSSTTDQIVHPGDAGTLASDFTPPAEDQWEFPQAPDADTATLPTGSDSQGQWVEYDGSASNGGVSSSSGSAIEPSVVSTGSGATAVEYVAWADNRSGVYEIYVARHSNGVWEQLAGSAVGQGISGTLGGRRPSLTLDASGNPIVAWTQFNGTSSDIQVAHYDPTANGGAGGWVAYGTSLNVSNTGNADNATIVNTSAGPVVAWLDTSSGNANVYVAQFTASAWSALGTGSTSGTGVSASASSVSGLSLATDGTNVAVAWTQPGTTSHIYLKQHSGSTWAAVDASASGTGLSGPSAASMPSVAYYSGSLYVAFASFISGTNNIAVVTNGASAWTGVSIDTPASAGVNQVSRGAASSPVLAVNGSAMDLVWVEDRLNATPDEAVAIYANRFVSGSFVRQLPGDASFDGILRRPTSLSTATGLALAVDSAGHPIVVWGDTSSGSSQIYALGDTLDITKIIYVNDDFTSNDSYTTASGESTNDGLTPSTPLDTLQAALNLPGIGAGTVILVDSGTYAGNVTLNNSDDGVLILGSPGAPTTITGTVTLTNVLNATLEGLILLNGGATINGGGNIELVDVDGGSPAQIKAGVGGQVTLSNTANIKLEHDSLAGLIFADITTNVSVLNSTVDGDGITVIASASGLTASGNNLTGIRLSATSQGSISDNTISGGGLQIYAPFTGPISHNLIENSGWGVIYGAAAQLSDNLLYDNMIGVLDQVNSTTDGLGFVAGSLPNQIVGGKVGVQLDGVMQDQYIAYNDQGVIGQGVLGGSSLDTSNLIEANKVGVSFAGTIQYDRIDRNLDSIEVQGGQLIDHDLIYNNVGANIETNGASDVSIINDTFYSTTGNNVQVDDGSTDVQVLNNIMWASDGYDLYIDGASSTGFFSDYNDLYTTGSGQIVYYLTSFTDILDWQDDVHLYDLHSIGTESVNPTGAQPQFVNLSLDDYRVLTAVAGMRATSPTVGTADPATDLGLPPAYVNQLVNASFESGLNGWTTNPGSSANPASPSPFDGSHYFNSGDVASGSAQQTVNLLAAGFTASQLDAQNLVVTFGGRIRSTADSPVDQGTLTLTFLDANHNPVGSTDTLSASNVTDRWELVGDRVHMPVGARYVVYTFTTLRERTSGTDDSYLDGAFLYVLPDTAAGSMGGYGNTVAEAAAPLAERIQLQSPDLYVNWELNQPHDILWSTFGNDGGAAVQIDLYQDVNGVSTLIKNITPGTADTGEFTWIPANSGLTYGMYGLRIQVSIVGNSAISDRSSETFAIPESGTTYYVNDGSTVGDEYTTAAGNNRATGKLPSAPLPLLTTLMREYSLGATSNVFVDTGYYYDFAPIELSGNPSIGSGQGATITGAVNHASVVETLGFTGPAVFDINDASFVTLNHLFAIGGDYGFWVRNGSTNFTGTYLTALDNGLGGLRLEAGTTGSSLDHIVATDNGNQLTHVGDGVYAGGPLVKLTNSTSEDNGGVGFNLLNAGSAIITGNIAFGNRDGLDIQQETNGATAIVGTTTYAPGQGNLIYDNIDNGIVAVGNGSGGIIVAGNTASGQTNAGDYGIHLGGGASGTGNIVYDNYEGIRSDGGAVTNNQVYNNVDIGIEIDGANSAIGNVVYNNGIGIETTGIGSQSIVKNNLVYNNSVQGIWIFGGSGSQIYNNTVYQSSGDALRIDPYYGTGSNINVENNIIWALGSAVGIVVAPSVQVGFHSDYNDIYATGSGQVGTWQNVTRPNLQSWQFATGQDFDSLSADPLFVNIAGGDFHEQSTTGSYHGGSLAAVPVGVSNQLPTAAPGVLTADGQESPVIDRGDAAFGVGSETAPNGAFINLGAYGGTVQASQSPTNYVLVLTPQAGTIIVAGQTTTIVWRSEDMGDTVNIDLMQQGNSTPILSIAADVANSGSFSWSIPTSLTAASNYSILVTRNSTSPVAGSSGTFTISAQTHIYYVNDGTVVSGDLTTAPGDDANSGLDPAHPKASIQAILNEYTLGPGDVIEVDRGIYDLSTNIVIPAADAGVTIEGYQTTSNASQWASVAFGAGAEIDLPLAGDQTGAFGIGDTSTAFNASSLIPLDPSGISFGGFTFEAWIDPSPQSGGTFFDFTQYTPPPAPLYVAAKLTFDRGAGNDLELDGTFGGASAPNVLKDNIWQFIAVTISTDGDVTFYRNGQSVGTGHINPPGFDTQYTVAAVAGNNTYSNAGYQGLMEQAVFLGFVQPAFLLSQYSLTLTTPILNRENTSVGADVFDVEASDVTIEDLSMTNADIAVSLASGGATGTTISNNSMYELQDYGVYVGPGNDGTSITDNQINVMAGFYEGGIYDYSSTLTISGNTISNAANAGILGYVGKGTLITGNNIFDNTVGINLDTTTITQNIVHDNSDYGINATTGTLVTGNTVYNNHGTSFEAGIVVTGGVASGNVAFGNGWGIIAETGSTSGNLVYGNIYGGAEVYNGASFSDNVVEGNSGYGIFLNLSYYGAPGGALTNNVVYGNAGGGLDVSNATGFLIQNNTVYQTSGDALDITSAYYGLTLRDNIFWATSGADINISAQAQPAVTSDYNDLYFSSSGVLGISNGVSYFTLLDWTNATGFDVDSISADPLFVNIAGNDFHEQSQFGTYQGGSLAVVLDNETGLPTPVTATLTDYSNQSPVIDAGAPTDAFNLEPTPNGGYDNIGAYGDSPQASLSPTEYLNVLQPHAGQTLATGQTYTILWRTQDNGGTVEIDLLNDQNQLIETIAGAAANSGSFAWSVPTALSSGNYSIRITRSDGAGVGQGSVFILATSTGIYYVNDAIVTAGDWTTAPGNNANSGLDPAHPKASISAILAAYQLSPGNIIMVDDGTYNLTNNITIPSADSGIIIEGFTNSSGVLLTTLNRQNISAGAYAFSLTGATNVTIENFEIINSYAGVVANDNSGSTGLTVTGLNIHLFYQVGVYIGSGNNGATIDDNSIHDGSFPGVDYYGIQTVSSDVTITNNTIYDSDMYGIYMQGGSQSLITNNQIYNNSTGIYADTATISGNTVHDNANSGINGSSSLIIGNTVYNNFGGGNQAGIFAQNSTANNNVAYANVNGIDVSSSTASNNRVYDNSTYGMIVQFGTATGNFIYSNGGGIFGTGIPVLLNNLIYDNSSFGILIQSVPNATVLGNTIYQPTGDGIQVVPNFFITTSSIFVEDNIIWTMQGRDFLVPDFQSSAVYSNYNDLYATGTGEIGNFGGEDFATLAAWTTELGLDRNSISSDPQFANIGGIDGQVGFVNGVDHGVDDNFNVQSTSATIDAGDPSQSYSAEPSPNGGRINLGYTGGTAQATHSAAQTIQVISPAENSRAQQGQTVPITWNSAGLTDPNPNNAYTQAALSENPLVYLKLDETSGTTAVDSSGNGLNGVYVDGPTLGLASVFGSGQGSAVGFNGGTDTVTVSSTALDLTETVTLSAWIKPTAFATTWQPIFYKGVGDYMHRTYTVWLNSSGYILLDSFDGSNERTLASPSGSVPLNVWTHIAVVMDRSTGTAEIYINGALAASAAPGAFPEVPAQDSAAEPLYIGYTPENSPQFGIFRYTGEIDEAAVFNTALTAAQVNAQYNAGKGSFHIDLLNSSGTVVQSIATSVYGTSFNWTIPTSLAPGMYQVRVTSDLTGAAAGTSQPLMVVSAGHSYYVNDGSLTGDATDTAVGNNANDGKSPSTPMASIEAVINTYHPGAGDTIFVENGTYSILQNITIYAADSGLTIQGPAANGTVATINRGNTSDYDFIFQDGTHNITIDHLTLTGALDAIFAPDESYGAGIKNITVSNNVIFGNIEAGVSIATNDTGWLITGNTIHDNNGSGGYVQDGIYASGTSATVTNNTVYNQVQYGIYVQGPAGSIISGNTVYTNAYGIDATNATINNNLAHDNTIDGICVDSGSLAIGNTAWRQTAYGAAGFRVSSGELRGNAAYGNYNGIYIDGSYAGTTDDNRVYSNTNYGIYIYGSGYDHIFNNLVYNNSNGGIYAYDTFAGASIINNTVYQPVNDAINLAYSYNDSIENNILWVEAGYDIDVTDGTSQNGLVSDFNLLHAGTGANAHVGFWNGAAQTQLADWQAASGMDTHSAAADPLFVSTSGVDGVQGYNSTANNGQGFDGGADDNFFLSAASPAIGIGNPAVAPSTDLIGQSRQTPAGPVDVGAYAFTGTSNDTTPPNIVATTPAGINSSGQVTSLSSITVTFNEPINPIDASAVAEYDLRSAGPDGLFNTGDDVVYPITPTYTPGNTFVTLNFAGGPLPYGTYRLEIFGAGNATIHDLSGLALAGGNYVRTFTIAAASPLTLSGTAEYLKLDADGQHIDIWSNSIPSGMMTQYLLSSVSSVTYDGTGIFVLDFSAGDPLPASGLDFAATGSQNTLEIIGTSSNDNIVVAAGSVMFNSIPIAFTNAQTLIIDPGMGADSLAVNAGTVTLPAGAVGGGILTRHFASLSIANGATVLVTHANTSTDCTVLVTDSLSIAGTGKLDLSNNDMLIHGGSDIFSQLTSQLLTGFNGGQWTGVSIASSAATNSTTLGIELNDDGTTNHGVLLNSFDGQNNLVNTDLLIKYTYFGDADLSGTVTAADYLLIDNGFNNGGVGWHNGDFNYDGVINGDDYTLIDNAYNSQGSVSFAAAPASQIATDAPQVVVASKVSTFAMSGIAEVRQFVAVVANPLTGDNTDTQELKKRRLGVWEMLKA